MKIEATPPLQMNLTTPSLSLSEQPQPSFAHFLSDHVSTTNSQLLAADHALQQLAGGHAQSLHQTMLTLEEAKLSFQFLEQIRNRLMSAYQDILREQI